MTDKLGAVLGRGGGSGMSRLHARCSCTSRLLSILSSTKIEGVFFFFVFFHHYCPGDVRAKIKALAAV